MTRGAALVPIVGSSIGIVSFLERLDQAGLELSQMSLEEIPYAELVSRYRSLTRRMTSGQIDEAGPEFLQFDHDIGLTILEALQVKQIELQAAKNRAQFASVWEAITGQGRINKMNADLKLTQDALKAIESARNEAGKTLRAGLHLEAACDSFIQLVTIFSSFGEKCSKDSFLWPSQRLREYFSGKNWGAINGLDAYKAGLNSMITLGVQLAGLAIDDEEIQRQAGRIIELTEKIKHLEPLDNSLQLIQMSGQLEEKDLGITHGNKAIETIETATGIFQQIMIHSETLAPLLERKLDQHVKKRLQEMSSQPKTSQ